MAMPRGDRTPRGKRDALMLAMLGGASVNDAAAEAGIPGRTARAIAAEDGFRAELAAMRARVLDAAGAEVAEDLAQGAREATALLRGYVAGGYFATDATHIRAAEALVRAATAAGVDPFARDE